MIRDIEHQKRTVFKKSFLKNVQFVLSYSSFEMEVKKKNMIVCKLQEAGFDVKHEDGVAYIQGAKNKTFIVMTAKGVVISIDKEDYTGYEYLKEYILWVSGLLAEIGISECSTLVFQKQNAFKLDRKEGLQISKEELFSILFADDVVANTPVLGRSGEGAVYTVQPLYKEEEKYVLAELLVSAMFLEPVGVKDVAKVADGMNEDLYDLWYASVNESVITLMNRE